jgi:RNA polymerase-binding transcription factor DksA
MLSWHHGTPEKQFKDALLKEQEVLESELASMGQKNPTNSSDWDAKTEADTTDDADEGDVADSMQEFENKNSEVEQLEVQLKDVKSALEKIEDGNYGKCEVCGEDIEVDRLTANPSAKTCTVHMN